MITGPRRSSQEQISGLAWTPIRSIQTTSCNGGLSTTPCTRSVSQAKQFQSKQQQCLLNSSVEDDESRIDTSENCFSHRIFIRHWPRHRIPPATSRLEHDLAHLRSHGFQAFQLDVLDPSSIKDCVSSLAKRCPSGIGAMDNNAGIVIPGAVEELSREDLSKQFEVNVFGLQELTNTIIPTLRNQG